MTDTQRDNDRALSACRAILDGRDPVKEMGAVMVTTEHAVATILLAVMGGDARKAAGMLNEGLAQGVEYRLTLWAKRTGGNE